MNPWIEGQPERFEAGMEARIIVDGQETSLFWSRGPVVEVMVPGILRWRQTWFEGPPERLEVGMEVTVEGSDHLVGTGISDTPNSLFLGWDESEYAGGVLDCGEVFVPRSGITRWRWWSHE